MTLEQEIEKIRSLNESLILSNNSLIEQRDRLNEKNDSLEQEIERLENRYQTLFLNIDIPRTELILKIQEREEMIKEFIDTFDLFDEVPLPFKIVNKMYSVVKKARKMVGEDAN